MRYGYGAGYPRRLTLPAAAPSDPYALPAISSGNVWGVWLGLDASTVGLSVGSSVATFADRVNGRVFTQPSLGLQPTYDAVTGEIVFTTAQGFPAFGAFAGSGQGWTILHRTRLVSTPSGRFVHDAAHNLIVGHYASKLGSLYIAPAPTYSPAAPAFLGGAAADTASHVLGARRLASGAIISRRDGTTVHSAGTSYAGSLSVGLNKGFADEPSNIRLKALLMLTGDVSDTDLAALEAWLTALP